MSDKIKYPITVYDVNKGQLFTTVFKNTKNEQHSLEGKIFTRISDLYDFVEYFSTDYEETKKLAIKETKEILRQAEANVVFYKKQLRKLEE